MKIELKIEKLTDKFVEQLSDISKFTFGTQLSYLVFEQEYSDIFSRIPEDKKEMLEDLKTKIPTYNSEITTFAFINYIVRTEGYLNEVIEILYRWKKQSLISKKKISYAEVIKSENIDDLINSIRNREILEFSYGSITDKISIFEDRFNLDFTKTRNSIGIIVEMFTTRNIILHNDGIVNQTYLDINKSSKLKLGEKRTLDEKYLDNSRVNLAILGRSVEESIKKKIARDRKPSS